MKITALSLLSAQVKFSSKSNIRYVGGISVSIDDKVVDGFSNAVFWCPDNTDLEYFLAAVEANDLSEFYVEDGEFPTLRRHKTSAAIATDWLLRLKAGDWNSPAEEDSVA